MAPQPKGFKSKFAKENHQRWRVFSMKNARARASSEEKTLTGLGEEEKQRMIEEHMDKKGFTRGPTLWANGSKKGL